MDRGFAIDVEVILGTYQGSVISHCPSIYIPGEHDIRDKSETKELRLKAIPPFLVHEKYKLKNSKNHGYLYYDFTLLELSQAVDFSLFPHIRPVCLPASGLDEAEGDQVTVVGWGNTRVDHIFIGDLKRGSSFFQSNTLQKIDLR